MTYTYALVDTHMPEASQLPECKVRCDVTYLGLVTLLPRELHGLCACAGLFFARVLHRIGTEDYWVQVAALPHYFDADEETQRRHVRTMLLSLDQCALLVEWDRRLAGMATCDVRGLVEEHVDEVHREQQLSGYPDTALSASEPAAVQSEEEQQEETDLVPLPTLFVARSVIEGSLQALHITSKKERRVQTALLHAALSTLKIEVERSLSGRERRELERQYEQIHAVQEWRRRQHGWQRVVTLEPVWQQDRAGWNLMIGVPVLFAA